MSTSLVPPLRFRWHSSLSLAYAVPSGDKVYGATHDGRIASVRIDTGAHWWQTSPDYLKKLSASGNKIFIYKKNQGLFMITDNGATYMEKLFASLSPCDENTPLSHPLVDGDRVYIAHRSLLLAFSLEGKMLYGAVISDHHPNTLLLWGSRRLVVVDGLGQPSVFRAEADKFVKEWSATLPSPGNLTDYRPALVHENRLLTAGNGGLHAFDFTGKRLWQAGAVRPLSLFALGDTLYAAAGGAVWSVRPTNGAVNWARHWLYPSTRTAATGVVAAGDFVYVGNVFANPTTGDLFAVRRTDGLLVWHSRGRIHVGGAGVPVLAGDRMITYGTTDVAECLTAMEFQASVAGTDLVAEPRPFRGAEPGFSNAGIRLSLRAKAHVTIAAWREASGLSDPVLELTGFEPGTYSIPWDARQAKGFTAAPQFGRLVMDVIETATNLRYTVASPVPVNTMPDIVDHWAREQMEIMLYHQYVNGYPDLTFKPDFLVTRAESATIIAKTLGLAAPSPGFVTRFTDIAGHWAENSIKALEEKDIISGFREPDGTYTYRPEARMTRAQEARILVKAYAISGAPGGFQTKFTDIAGHWAEADIKALEYHGYTTGFAEPDGTRTYRPEQLLTRAELCVLVVRIRKLTRPA